MARALFRFDRCLDARLSPPQRCCHDRPRRPGDIQPILLLGILLDWDLLVHIVPHPPTRISGPLRGLATSLEALLKAGYTVASYAWVDIDPKAHTTVSHVLKRLTHQCPQLLPL